MNVRRKTKITTTALAVTVLAVIFLMPTAGAGQVIDRIVARVNGSIILQSELDAARESGYMETSFHGDNASLMYLGDWERGLKFDWAGETNDVKRTVVLPVEAVLLRACGSSYSGSHYGESHWSGPFVRLTTWSAILAQQQN